VGQIESFGHWLRRKRRTLDLTQAGLGDLVGCSAAAIRKFEAEERRPSVQIATRIGQVLDIPRGEQAAFIRFARGDTGVSLAEHTALELPWRQEMGKPRGNLPAPANPIIGRKGEIDEIRSYLLNPDIRMVTLIGPPGIGKTRLCLEVAHSLADEYSDGPYYVRLAPLDEPTLIPPTVLRALGFHETDGSSVINQISGGIGTRLILVVLDNCEHLIEHVALLASELLRNCPNLKLLATSREPLRIPGEWLYTVPLLATPGPDIDIKLDSISDYPALILFTERARAARSGFTLDEDNLQAVIAICTQLDGLPLAIELIASRTRMMSPRRLLETMSGEYILSADGMRAVSVRQKTLNNAIDWSYEFLSQDEKNIFVQLAVFSGGFSLEAAEAVCANRSGGIKISDIVTSLVDKSLLQRRFNGDRDPRFYMLVTIRQFAFQKLQNLGIETQTQERYLDYLVSFTEMAAAKIRGPELLLWSGRLEEEHDNLRAALDWSITNEKTESALRFLRALGWSWEIHGHYSEAHCWLDRIMTLPNVEKFPEVYAGVLNHIGRHSWSQGNIRDARSLLENSQSISRKIGEAGELTLAEALNWLGLVSLYGDNDCVKAREQIDEGLGLFQKWSNRWGIALARFHQGIVEKFRKQYDASVLLLKESLSEFKALEDAFFIARVCAFIGEAFHEKGDLKQARVFLEKRLEIDQDIEFWSGMIEGWYDLGKVHVSSGEYDLASSCYEQAVAVCAAHNLFNYDALYWSSLLALMNKQYKLAYQRFAGILEWVIKTGKHGNLGPLLSGLASAAAGLKLWEMGATLFGAADSVQSLEGRDLETLESTVYAPYIQDCQTNLGILDFEDSWNKGLLLSLGEVHNLVMTNQKFQDEVI